MTSGLSVHCFLRSDYASTVCCILDTAQKKRHFEELFASLVCCPLYVGIVLLIINPAYKGVYSFRWFRSFVRPYLEVFSSSDR